jgi:hypothetical protein
MSWKSGSWNLLGHTRPVTGSLYLYIFFYVKFIGDKQASSL